MCVRRNQTDGQHITCNVPIAGPPYISFRRLEGRRSVWLSRSAVHDTRTSTVHSRGDLLTVDAPSEEPVVYHLVYRSMPLSRRFLLYANCMTNSNAHHVLSCGVRSTWRLIIKPVTLRPYDTSELRFRGRELELANWNGGPRGNCERVPSSDGDTVAANLSNNCSRG